ncbi:MAG TPA: hypothetical protein VFN41_05820 [Candidatus Limnocylindrales bacterium]|nr:hypothetical protein [Candidatus Limnocylindrales bacterium]
MTTESDPRTRIVLSWLHEDAHEDAEPVLLRALDEVDTTAQRGRAWPVPILADTSSLAKLAIVAAAIVVIAVAGIQFLPLSGTSGGPPTASPTPTATPVFPQLTEGPLAPGRYALYDHLVTSIEVPAGWIGKPPFVRKIGADGSGLWWGPRPPYPQVFSDACQGPKLTTADGTVQGLVDALDAQVGTDATITEATLGGLPATRVDLVKDPASCSGGADGLRIWSTASGSTALEPDARGIVYVLEKDGELAVFMGIDFKATASDTAELERVIASTRFGP